MLGCALAQGRFGDKTQYDHGLYGRATVTWQATPISDSSTSYGSYSDATPNEKITWDKLTEMTPMFSHADDGDAAAAEALPQLGLDDAGRRGSGRFRRLI